MSSSGPFRTSATSETLERLAQQGLEKRRELPLDARKLDAWQRNQRLQLALGVAGHDATGWSLATLFSGVIALVCTKFSNGIALGLFAVTLGLGIWSARLSAIRERERAERIAATLAWAKRMPFPMDGYAEWICSEEPLLDVVATRALGDAFEAAVHAIDPAASVELLDERTARIAIPPRTVGTSDSRDWFGDVATLTKLTEELLVPLHAEIGIVHVAMGGRMHRT